MPNQSLPNVEIKQREVEISVYGTASTNASVIIAQLEKSLGLLTKNSNFQFNDSFRSALNNITASIEAGALHGSEGFDPILKVKAKLQNFDFGYDLLDNNSDIQFSWKNSTSFGDGIILNGKFQNSVGIDLNGNLSNKIKIEADFGRTYGGFDFNQTIEPDDSKETTFLLKAGEDFEGVKAGLVVGYKIIEPSNMTPIPRQNIIDELFGSTKTLYPNTPIPDAEIICTNDTLGYRFYNDTGKNFTFSEEDYDSYFDSAEITKNINSPTNDYILANNILPQFKPSNISIHDSDTNQIIHYIGLDADAEVADYNLKGKLSSHINNSEELDYSQVREIENVNGKVYLNTSDKVGIPTSSGIQQVSVGSLVNMVTEGAKGLAAFTAHIVENTIKETYQNIEQQYPIAIAQIIAGVLQGQDIDDILTSMATNMVGTGAMNALIAELTKDNQFSSLTTFQNNNPMAIDAIKGALGAVAVTAILNGKEAGIQDYAKAAATAGVQRIISNGITGSGYAALTHYVPVQQVPANFIGPVQKVAVPTAAGAGAIAAITVLASSIISGNGITKDTVRSAAVAGAVAYASTAAANAIVVGMQIGAAGGPLGIAVGIVIGAVIGLVLGNSFSTPGERIYHNETIGSYIDGDTIIGIREGGALLKASITSPNLLGSDAGADVLVGNEANNIMLGLANDDFLEGRGGDDYMIGGLGSDHLEGGAGNDYLEGNEDNDKILAGDGDDAVLGGSGHDVISGGAGNDHIEGGEGEDLIYGDSGNDVILGGTGTDTISGGLGDDVISGEDGDDILDGGLGNDEIHGGNGDDVLFGGEGNDAIHGDSGSDIIYGDAGTDVIYGDLGDDLIDGGQDDDLIFGGLGNDVLFGASGDDFIYGEIGDDFIVGGRGNDFLNGGEGNDVYTMNKGDGSDVIEDSAGEKDIIRLANYTLADFLRSEVSFIKSGNDLLLKTSSTDEVTIKDQFAGKQIEYLMLSDGKVIDLRTLTFGTDNIARPDNTNLVSNPAQLASLITQGTYPGTWQEIEEDRSFQTYNQYSSWYTNNFDTAVMSDTERQIYNDVQVGVITIKDRHWHGRTTVTYHYYDYFENHLIGTNGPDRIVGAYWNETIDGLGGNDQLYGNGGNDTVNGGADNDLIFGGSQDDIIHGDSGNDRIYGGIGNDNITGDDGNDALYGEWGVDNLQGGAGDDLLSGGFENDNLDGGAGNDILYGDQGNDILRGGTGNDFLIGADGEDTIYGDDGDDYLEGGNGADYLDGGAGNDILRGEGAGDQLIGGLGDDLLIGGKGGDVINGGSGIDTASYAESDSGVIVNITTGEASGGYAGGDNLTSIENITGSDYDDILTGNSQNNVLIGGYGNDKLYGGEGNDILEGGAGADYLDGGAGLDKVSYADSNSGVEVNLATGKGRFGYADGDVYVNMEHVVGSKYDDKFIIGNANIGQNGNPAAITFEGGAGDDAVVFDGNVSDYNITLDGTKYIVIRKSDNVTYTLPDVEKISFADRTLSYRDFPGNGDGVAHLNKNNSLAGIIDSSAMNITYVLNQNPGHGNLIFNQDKTYKYIPETNFTGRDSFSYKLTNAEGLSRITHVGISVTENGMSETSILFNQTITQNGSVIKFDAYYAPEILTLSNGDYLVTSRAEWFDSSAAISSKHNMVTKRFDKYGTQIGNDIISTNIKPWWGYNSERSIVELSNKNLALFYQDYNAWPSGVLNAYVKIITPDGNTIKTIDIANSINTIDQDFDFSDAALVSLEDGGFLVTFNKMYGNKAYLQKYDSNGNKVDQIILPKIITQNYSIKLTQLSNSDILVSWEDMTINTSPNKDYIYGTIIHNNTNNLNISSDIFTLLSSNARTNMSGSRSYDIKTLSSNSFVIARIENPDNIHVSILNTNGKVINDCILRFNTTGSYAQKVNISSINDNYFLISWSESSETITSQLFDLNGNAIGNYFRHDNSRNSDSIETRETYDGGIELLWYVSGMIYSKIIYKGEIQGTQGNDILQGTSSNDKLIGHGGADILDGNTGIDTASYADSDTAITIDLSTKSTFNNAQYSTGHGGDAEGDRLINIENLIGSSHNDNLTGDANANNLDGGNGNDVLIGGAGDDILLGGTGNDILNGGSGNNSLTLGLGADIVVVNANANATDIVADFNLDEDKIDLSAFGTSFASITDVKAHLTQQNADTLLSLPNGQTILLKNINAADLSIENFIGNLTSNHAPSLYANVFNPGALNANNANINAGANFNITLHNNFSDNDGDALTYSLTQTDGSALPSWLSFNPVTLALSGIAPAGFSGILNLAFSASDGHGGITAEHFIIQSKIALGISGANSTNYANKTAISLQSLNQNSGAIPVTETPDGKTVFPDALSAQRLTLTQDGDVTVTFKNSVAGFSNSLGWYVIDQDGTISNPQLLIKNAHFVEAGTQYNLGNLPAGSQLGFFIAADGGNALWVSNNGQYIAMHNLDLLNGTLKFVNNTNNPASVYGSAAPILIYTLAGVEYRLNEPVYHSANNAALNPDNALHAGAGWDSGKGDLLVGFEDVNGSSDQDYNDILFHLDLGSDNEAVKYAGAPQIAQNFAITGASNIASAEIKISSGYKTGDTLVFEGHNLVNGIISGTNIATVTTITSGVLSLKLAGTASSAEYEALIHSIKLVNIGNTETSGMRDIAINITDSIGNNAASTSHINITHNPVLGTNAADNMVGTSGSDNLHGKAGSDLIHGGFGSDLLTGGSGSDSFDFSFLNDSKNGAYDTITDFQQGIDHINLYDLANNFADLNITHTATETIITANDNHTDHFELHLQGIIDLKDSDFSWG